MLNYVVHSDLATVFTASNERSDRFRKIERIYLIEAQVIFLKVMQQFCVPASARTERLDSECARAGLAKMGEEYSGQHGFAHAGVSAADENNARSLATSHAEELTTDEHG